MESTSRPINHPLTLSPGWLSSQCSGVSLSWDIEETGTEWIGSSP